MPGQPAKLAITNQKGGVGKTTVAINVAGALADAGRDALVVDLDPQGYLTNGVGLDGAYTAESPTLYDALLDPDDHDLADLTLDHPEFDVVAANVDMFNLEQELVSAMQGRLRLRRLFESSTLDAWDHVVVDCPPSLGHLTDNALLGASNLVIPAEAEDTSIRALDILFRQIDTLEANFDATIRERAVVVSNVDYPLDNDQKAMLQWFDERFAEYVPVVEVRNRAAIKRAYNHGVSIFEFDEDCDQLPALQELAEHLIAVANGGDGDE
jgi:chromosome partitioning protein